MTEEKGLKTYEEIMQLMNNFKLDSALFYEKGNKTAGTRARKALDHIAKLKVQWRKETV